MSQNKENFRFTSKNRMKDIAQSLPGWRFLYQFYVKYFDPLQFMSVQGPFVLVSSSSGARERPDKLSDLLREDGPVRTE